MTFCPDPCDIQVLLLALCLGISPSLVPGTIWYQLLKNDIQHIKHVLHLIELFHKAPELHYKINSLAIMWTDNGKVRGHTYWFSVSKGHIIISFAEILQLFNANSVWY